MKNAEFENAKNIFYNICKIYNRWKVNNRSIKSDFPELTSETEDIVIEFGVDDYIKAKANYAESIMNIGDIEHATEKFENVKKTIENEIIYENPLLYVNVCN